MLGRVYVGDAQADFVSTTNRLTPWVEGVEFYIAIHPQDEI